MSSFTKWYPQLQCLLLIIINSRTIGVRSRATLITKSKLLGFAPRSTEKMLSVYKINSANSFLMSFSATFLVVSTLLGSPCRLQRRLSFDFTEQGSLAISRRKAKTLLQGRIEFAEQQVQPMVTHQFVYLCDDIVGSCCHLFYHREDCHVQPFYLLTLIRIENTENNVGTWESICSASNEQNVDSAGYYFITDSP